MTVFSVGVLPRLGLEPGTIGQQTGALIVLISICTGLVTPGVINQELLNIIKSCLLGSRNRTNDSSSLTAAN